MCQQKVGTYPQFKTTIKITNHKNQVSFSCTFIKMSIILMHMYTNFKMHIFSVGSLRQNSLSI